MTIFKGDNTAAFGGNLLTISINSEIEPVPTITRAELKIGCICKNFINPTFPLTINLTEEETSKLSATNTAYLAVWDSQNRKRTCMGSLTFNISARRV